MFTHIIMDRGLTTIEFDDEAYDRLVLPKDKKTLVRALVAQNQTTTAFSDVITGKGGGVIFLLHGSPGTGNLDLIRLFTS